MDGQANSAKPELTPKQEAFAQAYVETGNASEAYRRAYNAENMKSTTVMVKACTTLAQYKIRVRVEELQGEALERHNMTVDSIAELLMEDRDFARENGTPAAAVTASMGLAKLYGLLADKVEHSVSKDLADIIAQGRQRVANLNG